MKKNLKIYQELKQVNMKINLENTNTMLILNKKKKTTKIAGKKLKV